MKTTGNQPYYLTIKTAILDKICQGVWPVDARLPTEENLMNQFQVSRGTVRRAMADLENDGYISRRAGVGTMVVSTQPALAKQLSEIKSISEQLVEKGIWPDAEVLFAGLQRVGDAEGRVSAFGLPVEAEVIKIRRLIKGDGIPFAIQTVYLLPAACPGLLEESGERLVHLFRLYREKYQVTIEAVDELFRAAVATTDETNLLQIEAGAPLIIRDRLSYNQNGMLFEILHSVDRGDKFAYHYQSAGGLQVMPQVGKSAPDKRMPGSEPGGSNDGNR